MKVAISAWGSGLYFINSNVKVINSLISRPLLFCDSCGILSFFLWVEQRIRISASYYCFSSVTFFWFFEHFKLFLFNLATYRTVVFWLFLFNYKNEFTNVFSKSFSLGWLPFSFSQLFLLGPFCGILFILILSRLLFPLGLFHGVLIVFSFVELHLMCP